MAARAATKQTRRARVDPSPAAISVEHLTKVYGGRPVVDDLSFDVHWGKVTGFLGPNGAGKTTTIRAVLGLTDPTSGTATVLGRRFVDLAKPGRSVGAVLESSWFDPRRTGHEHLRSLQIAAGLPDDRPDRVLELVELTEAAHQKVGSYSLGMRQRLGLAAALLGAPRVLVLDEPANGLDPAGIRWLRRAMRKFADRGNAVLVSSHLLSEVSQLADELVVIDRGRLVAQGSVEELTRGEDDLEAAFFALMERSRS